MAILLCLFYIRTAISPRFAISSVFSFSILYKNNQINIQKLQLLHHVIRREDGDHFIDVASLEPQSTHPRRTISKRPRLPPSASLRIRGKPSAPLVVGDESFLQLARGTRPHMAALGNVESTRDAYVSGATYNREAGSIAKFGDK